MPATLKLDNFGGANIREKTFVSSAYSGGVGTSLTVKSAQNFGSNLYALVGPAGQEQTELRLINSIAGQVLTLASALTFDHSEFDDVTCLNYNQLKIYRAANVDGTAPVDGSFTLLTTVDIDPDNLTTTYYDATGGSSYWYKYTFFNQSTVAETAIADSTAFRGGSVDHYASLDNIRREAGFSGNTYISDVEVSDKRDQAEGMVNSLLSGSYDIPFSEPVPDQIVFIVEQLAAGYLLLTDYGPFASGTTKDGQAKVDAAMALLNQLRAGSEDVVDSSGNSLFIGSKVNGWPLDSTADAEPEDNGGPRLHRMSDVF